MKTRKLTREILDRLIEEVIEESKFIPAKQEENRDQLNEMFGMGLASSKPAFIKEPKRKKNDLSNGEDLVYRKCRTLEDIPPAWDSSQDNVRCLIDEETTLESAEEIFQGKVKDSIRKFQQLYRTLSPSVRFRFERWLRKALIKNISLEEAQDIIAAFQASSKGWNEPQNKNLKPK